MNAIHPPAIAEVASLRASLWDAGYRPIALKTGDKMPVANGWPERARQNPPADADDAPTGNALNTGILCDGLRVLDIDVDDADVVRRLRTLADSLLGDTPCIRTRSNSPRQALIYRAAAGEPGKRVVNGAAGKLEVLGRGQQILAFGRHPSGVDLRWEGPPCETPVDTLPAASEAQITSFLAAAAPLLGAEIEPAQRKAAVTGDHQPSRRGAGGDSLDVIAALAVLPNDAAATWEDWNRVGMATFAATGGRESGFAAWCAWSEKHPTHDPDAVRKKWEDYRTSPPSNIGAGTLFHLAAQARPGWTKPSGTLQKGGDAPDAKRPLHRALPPARPFPMAALGPLHHAAAAIQLRTQAPPAICAQAVLATATLAVQAHRDIELPGAGRRPLTGLFVSIAESGERKTSVDRIALAPVYKIEEQWRQDRESEVSRYANDFEAWKAAREAAKKAHKGDRGKIREALNAIGSEPKAPPQAMLLIEDFSPEALVLHLRDSRPWGGVFTSEGGVLVGGHAFSEDKAMQTATLFNTLWDGAAIRRARVLTGNAFLPGRRCSAHIMMQRVVANKLLGDSVLDGVGMTARMLIVEPESTIGARMFRDPPAECEPPLRAYRDKIRALLIRPPTTAPDAVDVLDPPALTLTPEAADLYRQFHDEVERDLAPGGELHAIVAFGAKLAEHAGRLAAVLTTFANPDAMEVDAEAMANGIELAQHYASEMLRLQGGASVSPELRLAARLLDWWQSRSERRCHLAAVYQTGPYALRDAATARSTVALLEEHGWVRRLSGGVVLDGAARRDAWELVP